MGFPWCQYTKWGWPILQDRGWCPPENLRGSYRVVPSWWCLLPKATARRTCARRGIFHRNWIKEFRLWCHSESLGFQTPGEEVFGPQKPTQKTFSEAVWKTRDIKHHCHGNIRARNCPGPSYRWAQCHSQTLFFYGLFSYNLPLKKQPILLDK